MSGNKRLKKAVRARMARTGETYSTARMRIMIDRDGWVVERVEPAQKLSTSDKGE